MSTFAPKPKPHRYQVTDYPSTPRDPRRMALIRDALVDANLTVAAEDEVRHLIGLLTAWLDAPRLAERATPTVVAEVDGYALLRTTAGEWGTRTPIGGLTGGDEWSDSEGDARAEFLDLTGTERCASCGEYRDPDEVSSCDDGYECIDETACAAARAAKESAK